MRLFALDLHISVIADLRDILKDHEIVEWSLSGHNWVFGRTPATPEIIHQGSWMSLTLRQLEEFRERYDTFLRGFDGFLTGHVMPYVMLFEPYGKPVFSWNTCRYDLPFCFKRDRETLEIYHQCLRRMLASGQLRAFCNNRADQEYFRLGTGLALPLLPSLCRYTRMQYRPVRPTFLWYSAPEWMPNTPLLSPRPHPFRWNDLCTYRGIVHLPYEISTMSLYEHYQAGIPLWVPTPQFLKKLWSRGAPWQSISAYWGDEAPHPETRSMEFWLERADFYDPENMRYVHQYNSWEDLLTQLQTFQDDRAEERNDWIRDRESRVIRTWNDTLKDRPAISKM